MNRVLKIGLILFAIIFFAFISICMLGYQMVIKSLPQVRGKIVCSELNAETKIYRDDYHIPHIFAENEYDLFFTQGFVTAQDRLWQMDLWRRIANGRLSEIIGRSGLASDSLMRTIGFRRIAQQILPNLSEESVNVYQAYTDGINAYLKKYTNKLPVEFNLFSYKPESWEIADCLSIVRWLQFSVNSNWETDAALGAIVERIGLEKSKDLFPEFDHELKTVHFSDRKNANTILVEWLQSTTRKTKRFSQAGSNAWAISGAKTTTGKPILANDPHMVISNPSVFYENHLIGAGFNVSGFSLPGLPGVILGFNQHIAWGITSLMADDQDLFVETLSSGDSTYYRVNGNYRKMEIIEEEIPVRLEKPIRMKIYKTVHGPVVSPFLKEEGYGRSVISLQWTGYDFSDEGLAYYRIGRAKNWNDFRSALKHYKIAPQVFIYADRKGNIGMQAAGKIPKKMEQKSYLPRQNKLSLDNWTGYFDFDDLPSEWNPQRGFVLAANQEISSKTGGHSLNPWHAQSHRYQRIYQLLSEKKEWSIQDFKRMQSDVLSLYATDVLNLVKPDLEKIEREDDRENALLEKLLTWDGQLKPGNMEAALFEVFLSQLIRNSFHDDLGDTLFDSFIASPSLPTGVLLNLLKQNHVLWFDVDSTTHIETRKEIVTRSFRESVQYLLEKQGENITKWSWGAMHTIEWSHPVGQHPLLRPAYNLGPYHEGGDGSTINCFGYSLKKPFKTTWGPAARMIVDLDNPDNSLSVLPTGQSGQPLDEHYRNQTQLFLANQYHPNRVDTARIFQSDFALLKLLHGDNND